MTPLLVLALAVSTATPVLTLDEALTEARQKNLDLQVARARLQQSQVLARKAWAGYLPTLSVGASYTRNSNEAVLPFVTGYAIRQVAPAPPAEDPNPGLPGAPTQYALVPSSIQEIVVQPANALGAQAELRQALLSPQLWTAIQSAHIAEDVATLSTANATREILFAVAQAYFGAASLQEAIRASERLREVNEARVKNTQARFEAGTVTRVALLRAQLDLARSEQDLLRARNSFASARLSLATLLQRDANFELALPPVPEVPEAGEDLASVGLEERPDVAAARRNVELARVRKTGAWLAYAPSLGLNAAYRVSNAGGFTGENSTWAVTLGAQWVLWDGGLREANLREESARVAEASALQKQAEVRVSEEVARARLEYENARANLAKAEEALALARESQRLIDISFKAGVATYLEVADANAALTGAEVGFVSERLQTSMAALRLLRAAGLLFNEELK
jgi:outer membrane protein TolC